MTAICCFAPTCVIEEWCTARSGAPFLDHGEGRHRWFCAPSSKTELTFDGTTPPVSVDSLIWPCPASDERETTWQSRAAAPGNRGATGAGVPQVVRRGRSVRREVARSLRVELRLAGDQQLAGVVCRG